MVDDPRTFAVDMLEKLYVELAKFPGVATKNDHYLALSYAVRDRLLHRWVDSAQSVLVHKQRTVIYLSAEYLIGPQLASNLMSLGLEDTVREAMKEVGLSLDELIEHEEEPGLGNGGLGRLAACYMDSLATLDISAVGHGLRYEFGIFDQAIRDGWQVERTDRWLRHGFPWEIRRYDVEHTVGFGGYTEHGPDGATWHPERIVKGVPYDVPIAGYGTPCTNFLRLWSALAAEEFDLDAFQVGEYWRAVDQKMRSENLTRVLYPNDSSPAGKQLRLEQQYFFVSCALQDCLRLMRLGKAEPHEFATIIAVQLNDTHPTLAIPELMRLLMDVHHLGWDAAWDITHRTFAYTNHTLMPEALETWPLPLVQRVLPRHLEIIYEINRRFLDEVRRKFPGDEARVRRMSLIGEDGDKVVRMAHLATVASHHVNGVAALHSRLLRETVLRDFAELWPERFTNVTNGVTPRRFVALANPRLASLIDEAIGDRWLRDLERLRELESHADDPAFQDRWRAVKLANKRALAEYLTDHPAEQPTGGFDPDALLDAQCKRIHEYKRQHLNLLHAIMLYERLRSGDDSDVPRTIVIAGKAAPAYWAAKLIVRLAHGVAEAIAGNPRTRDRLRLVFVPDFSVKTAQRIYPAADLSEQISTAGMEASGTGNMKFTLNGALTIGTLDGANVEIRERVGADHFFLFGLTADQVLAKKRDGYRPRDVLAHDHELAHAVELISSGLFSRGDHSLYASLVSNLVEHDPFLVLADFRAYADAQRRVATAWQQPASWARSSILNVARAGYFSSDRSIREYAAKIWHVGQ